MSFKINDGYRLPGVSRAGVPQQMQVKPHEGFQPDAIKQRGDYNWTVGDGPQLPFVATPPDWTEQAKCVGKWDLFDEPSAKTFNHIVKPICDSCPVKDLCLSQALADEDGLEARFRAGVRGGMLPRQRAGAAQGKPPRTACIRDHEYTPQSTRIRNNGERVCRICEKERQQRRRKTTSEEQAA